MKIYTINDKKEEKFLRHRVPIFKKIGHISVCYVCELNCQDKIKLGDEHDKYKWLDFRKALGKLTYNNSKKILRYTNCFLENAE